ncbi:bifunctional diguanylate cyclase/phosphodiesterase [Rhodobacter maris]|uniref:Diguanylate cyclase (GGDEF)-like protein n=1 Tax=Rhodobacter maris TaxID=446682 RepID=A0A285S7P2_9RHOB|nr:EAL domain-containing protein [Rhodobacter maris]SOC03414.1 diguanylate cyclase (GGDEF)-like protein [Rhodobacter maris]
MPFRPFSGILLVLGLAASLGGLFGTLQYTRSWNRLSERLEQDTYAAADHVELLIRSMRLSAEMLLEHLAPENLTEGAKPAIAEVMRENHGLAAALVLDRTGHVVAGQYGGGDPVGLDLSDRPYFSVHRHHSWDGFYVNAPIRARIDSAWSLPLSLPIHDREGQFAGVVAVVAQEAFFAHLRTPFRAEDLRVFLRMRPDGQFIALPDPHGTKPLPLSVRETLAPHVDHETSPHPGTMHYDLPDLVVALRQSPSGLFDVLALRSSAKMRAEALTAALRTGLGATVAAQLVGMAGLGLARWAKAAQTEAERARFLQERLRLATSAGRIGVWDLDILNNHEIWDETMHALYGLIPGSFEGGLEAWLDHVHPEDRVKARADFRRAREHGTDLASDYRILTPEGEIRVMRTHARFFRDRQGRAVRALGVNYDVTEQVAREAELVAARAEAEAARARIAHDALHDPLTGLANRRGMDLCMRESFENVRPDLPFAYLHLDVDRFKSINDVFGHQAGDHLLCAVARLLTRAAPEGAVVARMGGDEFAIFVQGTGAETRARSCAERFLRACREPVVFEGKKLWFSVSVGVSARAGGDAGELVQNADIALYEAKNAGRDRIIVFSPELRRRVEHTKRISDKLVDALRQDRIAVHFQPQIDARNQRLVGAEALVRWHDPEEGVIPPDRFLPVAREMGLLARIDGIVLRKSVETVRSLAARGIKLPRISVNVDVQRLMQPDLFEDLAALGPLPCPLAFELLETLDFDEITDAMLEVLARLRAQGIAIEIDDFGRGRTSLATVQRIRPDRLKIDRSLTAQSARAPEGVDPVVEAICNIGRALGIGVTAEGIESPDQAAALARIGCDCLQGFLFARPMSDVDLANWIGARSERMTA